VIEFHSPVTSFPDKKTLIIIGQGAGLTPEWDWMQLYRVFQKELYNFESL